MSRELEPGGNAEEGSKSATAAFEAALGLNPQRFVDDALDTVYDINQDAFQFARQEAATAGVLGAAKAAQKAAELDRGFNAIHHLVSDTLDQRMSSWERYCNGQIFTLPEGFFLPEDGNSYAKAKDSQRDGMSGPDLDLELGLARKKLEDARKESENLQREISLLERQAAIKRELDFSVAEMQKMFQEKPVQQTFEDIAKVVSICQQKIISLSKKHTEAKSLVDLPRENNLALYKDFTARSEDIQKAIEACRVAEPVPRQHT